MRTILSIVLYGCFLVAVPAAAQQGTETRDARPFGVYSVSIGAGLVNPETGSSTAAMKGGVDIGNIAERVSIHPALEYWKKTSEALDTRVVNRDLTLAGDVRYTFGGGSALPYIAAGPALHFLRSEATAPGVETEDSDTKVGLGFGGGVRFRNAETISWFAEAKYRLVKDLNSFRAFGGVALNL